MPDIIFIGAGPVGLFTAIQVKLQNPELNILMFEKYAEYQRKHVLIIDPESYKNTHRDVRFQRIISELHGAVRTSVLEEKLLNFAREIGIEIQYEIITSADSILVRYPSTSVIVGSDGSHSMIRQQIFGEHLDTYEDLQYIVEIKYEVEGTARQLNLLHEYLPAITQTNHLITEHVGKEKDGRTPVSMRIFVDKGTFDALKAQGVTFKNPLKLTDGRNADSNKTKKMFDSINAWLIAREDLTNERRITDSEKITAINLPVYRSKEFALEHANKKWFLVGDAALGVPYFRALNAGLMSGTQLAKIIHVCFHPPHIGTRNASSSYSSISSSLDEGTVIDQYNDKISRIADYEISWAQVRNSGVNMAKSLTWSSQAMPVSSSYLPNETRDKVNHIRMAESENSSFTSSGFNCTIS